MKEFLALLWSVFSGLNDWLVTFFTQASGLNEIDLFMLHAANERHRQFQDEQTWQNADEYDDWIDYADDYNEDDDYDQHI